MYFFLFHVSIRGSRREDSNIFIEKYAKYHFFDKITDTKYRNRHCNINFVHFIHCAEIIKKISLCAETNNVQISIYKDFADF